MAIPCDYDKEVDMVTTIGIDPHKATHTAVAINETETILGELTVPADRSPDQDAPRLGSEPGW